MPFKGFGVPNLISGVLKAKEIKFYEFLHWALHCETTKLGKDHGVKFRGESAASLAKSLIDDYTKYKKPEAD